MHNNCIQLEKDETTKRHGNEPDMSKLLVKDDAITMKQSHSRINLLNAFVMTTAAKQE